MRLLAGAVVAVAALLFAAVAAAAVISKHATTSSYSLTLEVGPTETMYTPAQVKAKHPTTGEVMMGGGMMSGDMSMRGMTRHLEVHIRSRATGKVLTDVMPSITLTDTSGTTMMASKVPVVAMEGVTEGASDYHYGNNVTLLAAHVYKVVVKVNGQQATFSFKAV